MTVLLLVCVHVCMRKCVNATYIMLLIDFVYFIMFCLLVRGRDAVQQMGLVGVFVHPIEVR